MGKTCGLGPEKADFSAVFFCFLQPASVTAAWATRSPWSISSTQDHHHHPNKTVKQVAQQGFSNRWLAQLTRGSRNRKV